MAKQTNECIFYGKFNSDLNKHECNNYGQKSKWFK